MFVHAGHSRQPQSRSTSWPADRDPLIVEVTRGKDRFQQGFRRKPPSLPCGGGEAAMAASCESWGDIDQPIYGRSAIKPMLALGLVESGAADAFKLSDAEIALACASHSGEPQHVDRVRAWLKRIGLSVGDLECGAAYALQRAGDARHGPRRHRARCQPQQLLGQALRAFSPRRCIWACRPRAISSTSIRSSSACSPSWSSFADLPLGHAPRGIDGCGIPTIAIPIANTARPWRGWPIRKICPPCASTRRGASSHAMTAEPVMVSGTGEFGSRGHARCRRQGGHQARGRRRLCGIVPDLGLGICLKVEDGTSRGCEAAMGHVLVALGVLNAEERAKLADKLTPILSNRAGTKIGRIRSRGRRGVLGQRHHARHPMHRLGRARQS